MTSLSAAELRTHLAAGTASRLETLEVLPAVDSTNALLARAEAPTAGHWHVAIADEQTAGRGRGSNHWRSAPGAGLWMSAAYTFEEPPAQVQSLTLALGVSIASAISDLCSAGVRIKWPNDLILSDGKLGGMLVELKPDGRTVICGIGINYQAPDAESLEDPAALPPIGLNRIEGEAPTRSLLAARILEAADQTLPRFADSGLAPWLERWKDVDWLVGESVIADQGRTVVRGIARGIDADGALLIDRGGDLTRVVSASIRRVTAGPA